MIADSSFAFRFVKRVTSGEDVQDREDHVLKIIQYLESGAGKNGLLRLTKLKGQGFLCQKLTKK